MDDSSSMWILFAVLWVAFGVGSAAIANTKNRNPVGYFFLGFFLGIIGLIITAVMPPLGAGAAGNAGRHGYGTGPGTPVPPPGMAAPPQGWTVPPPAGLVVGASAPPYAPYDPGAFPGPPGGMSSAPAYPPGSCYQCGTAVDGSMQFCSYCGTLLQAQYVTAPTASPGTAQASNWSAAAGPAREPAPATPAVPSPGVTAVTSSINGEPSGGGRARTVCRDITISGKPAFWRGERVLVEKIEPNPERPEYRNVVYSKLLDRKFLLADADLAP